jgi:hypothetical protein
MAGKFSAYLSIYNDWDILPASLRSVASHVDELVVVDGAYEWMVPYLTMLGIDPLRSDPRVYAALEASGIPFRVISENWKSEPEKRQAGYEACTHDYIYRVDADEVMYFGSRLAKCPCPTMSRQAGSAVPTTCHGSSANAFCSTGGRSVRSSISIISGLS